MSLPVAEAMVKFAEDKQRSYGHQVVAALPFAAIQSLGDVPKGGIERGVEQLALGQRPSFRSAINLGKAKAIGRLTAGVATTPLFLSGIDDLRSDDRKRQRDGAIKVVAAGTAFSATKGGIEAAIDKGVRSPDTGRAVRAVFGTRALTGAAGGLLTAKSIANSLDTRGKSAQERRKDAIMPYVVGGALGMAEGVGESALGQGLSSSIARRAALSKGLGRAAGGVIGTALLREISRFGTKTGMEKKAEQPVSDSYQAYRAAYEWAGSQPPEVVAGQAFSLQADARMGPMRRATFQGMADQARGQAPREPLRPGLADAAALGVIMSAPALALQALDSLPVDQRDLLLRDAMDRLAVSKGITSHLTERGNERAQGPNIYVSPETPAGVVAHEIGHAGAGRLRRATTGSVRAIDAHSAATTVSMLLPAAIYLATTERDFATPEDIEARAAFLESVGKLSTLVAAPKLAEEGLASWQGAKYLRQAGSRLPGMEQKVLLHSIARQLPAFATYAAPLALPFVAASQLRAKAREARERSP